MVEDKEVFFSPCLFCFFWYFSNVFDVKKYTLTIENRSTRVIRTTLSFANIIINSMKYSLIFFIAFTHYVLFSSFIEIYLT